MAWVMTFFVIEVAKQQDWRWWIWFDMKEQEFIITPTNGAKTTQINNALEEMRHFASKSITNLQVMALDEPARPFPTSFDTNSLFRIFTKVKQPYNSISPPYMYGIWRYDMALTLRIE